MSSGAASSAARANRRAFMRRSVDPGAHGAVIHAHAAVTRW
jgi:hypothetical protein